MGASDRDRSDDVDNIQRDIDRWKGGLTIVGVCLIAGYAMAFFTLKNFPNSLDAEKWGQFGDFLGGIMNPLVAFAAFYWLTRSVKLQKQELAETRQELALAGLAQQKMAVNSDRSIELAALAALVQAINGKLQVLNDKLEVQQEKYSSLVRAAMDTTEFGYGVEKQLNDMRIEEKTLNGERDLLMRKMAKLLGEFEATTPA